ncbi:MAG: hypothetical protein JO023_11385 [Chloroflexi bacterium]|nr:hypothetical protein [Chloroflexota bacterium]
MPWFKRFGLHLAAALGALGVFVGAAAVGANQYRAGPAAPPPVVRPQRTPAAAAGVPPSQRERSLVGVVRSASTDEIVVDSLAGREWHVHPSAGALLRLNGRGTPLESYAPGDRVVVIGVAQARDSFAAHAITGRRPAS